MAQTQTQSIPRDQFVLIAASLLHKTFIEAARTGAKNVFKVISGGNAVHLTTVRMEDDSTVSFDLSLDQSEYRGNLNYGAFRASLASLVANLAEAGREKKEFPVFGAEHDPDIMIFGITGVTAEQNQPNVMMLGADMSSGQAAVMLRLMYLEPEQFLLQQAAAEPPQPASG